MTKLEEENIKEFLINYLESNMDDISSLWSNNESDDFQTEKEEFENIAEIYLDIFRGIE